MGDFITLRHVSKTFPGVRALKDVSLRIRAGEIHGLAGENGAGKSTIIKVLTGVYRPDDGAEIEVCGRPVSLRSPEDAAALGIAAIYQDFSLFGNMSVAENIMFGCQKLQGKKLVNWRRMRTRAEEILKELEIDIPADESVDTLSVGKQQMVAIAKALVFDAKLLIMDEPTSTLSTAETEHLFRIMEKLRAKGVSILFVTHKLEEMLRMADRISVFRDGCFVDCREKSALTREELIRLMIGREVVFRRREESEAGEEVLAVEHLSRRGCYRDISFSLHRGEILGITGLVGSGRSEVLLTLFGVLQPDAGRIVCRGESVKIPSPAEATAHGFALIPENRLIEGTFLDKTMRENITLTDLGAAKGRGGLLSRKREEALALEYAKKLDVRPLQIETRLRNLSGGNMQKVVIAKWLLSSPDILLVDEPTNGVDIGAKTEIHNLLLQLAKSGKSILVVSSEMLEVLSLSDRILVMSKGMIAGSFSGREATQEMLMQAAVREDMAK